VLFIVVLKSSGFVLKITARSPCISGIGIFVDKARTDEDLFPA